jgi:hypothetical protein
MNQTNHRHRWLLRVRGPRPCDDPRTAAAAQTQNDLAHAINEEGYADRDPATVDVDTALGRRLQATAALVDAVVDNLDYLCTDERRNELITEAGRQPRCCAAPAHQHAHRSPARPPATGTTDNRTLIEEGRARFGVEGASLISPQRKRTSAGSRPKRWRGQHCRWHRRRLGLRRLPHPV